MLRLIWVSVVVFVLDQWSKGWSSANLTYLVPQKVTSFFNLTLAHNTGAAFSFLSDAGGWQRWFFVVLAIVVTAVLVVWVKRLTSEQMLEATGLVLIIGGALGNGWDRAIDGYVVDFLSFHYAGYYFATFNVADIAIFCGAMILIFESLRVAKQEKART